MRAQRWRLLALTLTTGSAGDTHAKPRLDMNHYIVEDYLPTRYGLKRMIAERLGELVHSAMFYRKQAQPLATVRLARPCCDHRTIIYMLFRRYSTAQLRAKQAGAGVRSMPALSWRGMTHASGCSFRCAN